MSEAAVPRRYRPYPAYRDSGVEWLGEVPEGWEEIRLKRVAKLNTTRSEVSGLDPGTSVSFLPMDAVGELGGLVLDTDRPLRDVASGYTYFADGDVLVAKITPCFENGKGALAKGLTNGIGFGTTELHTLRPGPSLRAEFLFYLSISRPLRRLGAGQMYGAGGQKRISDDFLANFEVTLPPLPEQRAIAAVLDRETARIDTLVEKKERLLELLDEKRTALISRAVTKGLDPDAPMKESGVERLGKVPAYWSLPPVYARWEVTLGKMLDTKRIKGETAAPYLRNVDVQWDHVNVQDLPEMDFSSTDRARYTLHVGDLLVCEGGEVGRTAIWRGELRGCFFQKAVHRVRPKCGDESRFLFYTMYAAAKKGVFVAGGNPNTIPHLTAVQLRHYRFPLPPLPEQQAIAVYLDRETAKIDALKSKIRHAIDLLKEYRTALISAAVTGKIDVRDEVAA